MKRNRFIGFVAALCTPAIALVAQAPPPPLAAPIARITPRVDTTLGDVRTDNYFWIRDDARKNPDVIAYLDAENRYTESVMKPLEPLVEKLYQEMKGRIKETDLSVPERIGNYYYYSRTEAGKQYPILVRKKGSLSAPEEVMLDENVEAGNRKYFRVGVSEVSPDDHLLAFTVDTTGGERYTLMVKDLTTGKILPDRVQMVNYSLEWAGDNKTLFYGMGDAANRSYRILRHTLGSTAADPVIAEEPDELFGLDLEKTKDRKFILINDGSFSSTEYKYLRSDDPMGTFKVIQPKTPDLEYSVEHHGNKFLIVTNDNAVNFKLVEAPDDNPSRASWKTIVPMRDSVLLTGVDVFKDYLVLYERQKALRTMRVMNFATGQIYNVDFPEPVYTFRGGTNPEYDSNLVRFTYTSLTTPSTVYDFNMSDKTRKLLKATEVLGGYDPKLYATERTWARASDGTMVPISLVYKKPLVKDGTRPMLLYAYGSYGSSTDPTFSSNNLSLLDRGFIFAIAHIRGGSEMGRYWYDQGKLLNKKNTFTDFIASAEHLIRERYTSKEKLAIRGGSAGGLLMGAVVNMRPDLFKAVVADVPFVDVINTMMDASIPLTTGEWIQWGDPHKAEYYGYMKSYSPYDNVERKAYPNMLVTAGLNDPRVGYWEPAKWVAKLRAMKTDNNLLLLRTNMGAGHGGSSGRYDALRDMAVRYAFIIHALGVGTN
ncbi:MAG TPA: S9 family peptidase [Gemmatimonadaceae bacterium]|nr:S9 family peptidase [Gemmatimonadaceae bacterium]